MVLTLKELIPKKVDLVHSSSQGLNWPPGSNRPDSNFCPKAAVFSKIPPTSIIKRDFLVCKLETTSVYNLSKHTLKQKMVYESNLFLVGPL